MPRNNHHHLLSAATMMKSIGALAILLAASSSCDAFFFSTTCCTTTTKRSSSSLFASTPIYGPINEDIFSTNPPLRIEGNSLKTWSGFQSNRVQVSIKSLGRPVEASVELWQTPSVRKVHYDLPTANFILHDDKVNIISSSFHHHHHLHLSLSLSLHSTFQPNSQ